MTVNVRIPSPVSLNRHKNGEKGVGGEKILNGGGDALERHTETAYQEDEGEREGGKEWEEGMEGGRKQGRERLRGRGRQGGNKGWS